MNLSLSELKIQSILIYHFIADYYNHKNLKQKAVEYSQRILQLIEESKARIDKSPLSEKSTFKDIEKNARITLDRNKSANTPQRSQKIGRNQRVKVKYSNGTVRRDKYKKLEKDIKEGVCSIIE